jgi:hypothetical protein
MIFARMVDRIFRNFHHQVFFTHQCLAGKARSGLQAPGFIEQIFFGFGGVLQRSKTFANDDVALRRAKKPVWWLLWALAPA